LADHATCRYDPHQKLIRKTTLQNMRKINAMRQSWEKFSVGVRQNTHSGSKDEEGQASHHQKHPKKTGRGSVAAKKPWKKRKVRSNHFKKPVGGQETSLIQRLPWGVTQNLTSNVYRTESIRTDLRRASPTQKRNPLEEGNTHPSRIEGKEASRWRKRGGRKTSKISPRID